MSVFRLFLLCRGVMSQFVEVVVEDGTRPVKYRICLAWAALSNIVVSNWQLPKRTMVETNVLVVRLYL